LRLVAPRSDDLSALEFQTNAIESSPLINTWCIKRHMALDRIFHRAAENFPIGDIAVATADNGWNSLDTEPQIGVGALYLDTVCLFHQAL
jgi:hypothetical protein